MNWIEILAAGLLVIGSALVLFAIRAADALDAPAIGAALPQRREEPRQRRAA